MGIQDPISKNFPTHEIVNSWTVSASSLCFAVRHNSYSIYPLISDGAVSYGEKVLELTRSLARVRLNLCMAKVMWWRRLSERPAHR